MTRTSRRPPPCAGQQRTEYCKTCPRKRFNHSDFAIIQLTEWVRLEKRSIVMLKDQIRDPQEKVGLDLAARLSELVVSFSWTAAEVAALADAGYYNISEDLLNEDKEKIIELGSFQALVDYHNNKQKDNGLSMERVYQYLADNPNYAKSEHWWTRDTTADFQPLNRTAQFETCRYESYKYIERLRQECMLRMQDIHYYWTVRSKLCTRRDPNRLCDRYPY
jgi:hypothetical protein